MRFAAVAPTALLVVGGLLYAAEPASIKQVKTIAMAFDNEAKDAQGNTPIFGAMILTELEAQLPKAGFTVTTDRMAADAELYLTATENKWFSPMSMKMETTITYGVRILTVPSHQVVFANTGSVEGKVKASKAYQLTAAQIVKAITDARR